MFCGSPAPRPHSCYTLCSSHFHCVILYSIRCTVSRSIVQDRILYTTVPLHVHHYRPNASCDVFVKKYPLQLSIVRNYLHNIRFSTITLSFSCKSVDLSKFQLFPTVHSTAVKQCGSKAPSAIFSSRRKRYMLSYTVDYLGYTFSYL